MADQAVCSRPAFFPFRLKTAWKSGAVKCSRARVGCDCEGPEHETSAIVRARSRRA